MAVFNSFISQLVVLNLNLMALTCLRTSLCWTGFARFSIKHCGAGCKPAPAEKLPAGCGYINAELRLTTTGAKYEN
jgi:hypothetical protein